MRTCRQLCVDALILGGFADRPEDLESQVVETARTLLNNMLGLWHLEGEILSADLPIYSVVSAGGETMTIGDGSDIDTQTNRPDQIVSIRIQDGSIERPLRQINPLEWDDLIRTPIVSVAYYFTYEKSWPEGVIKFYPSLQAGASIKVRVNPVVGNYEMSDVINLPMGMDHALTWNLASMVCQRYGKPRQDIESRAQNALDTIRASNLRVPSMQFSSDITCPRSDRVLNGFNCLSDY